MSCGAVAGLLAIAVAKAFAAAFIFAGAVALWPRFTVKLLVKARLTGIGALKRLVARASYRGLGFTCAKAIFIADLGATFIKDRLSCKATGTGTTLCITARAAI